MNTENLHRLVLFAALCGSMPCGARAGEIAVLLDTPEAPPEWALLERALLEANARACEAFFRRYFDERGYLLCVERWGGDDGPDDALECLSDWTLLHALGAPDRLLRLYLKGLEGHFRQYTEARTVEVPFARDGMYYKEFPVMFDWLHHGEMLTPFNLQGLSTPNDEEYIRRTRRFAGFYMNEDPQAPNYDSKHRIIRSLFNGSRGPLLRKATALDWAGDPIEVEGRFALGHGERNYEEMLAHFKDYTDVIGDHPQNLSATTLALNAYLLTGEEKYKRWILEYVDAWVERTEANGGIIPSNIGFDGTIGGAAGGKWYGGVYGWGFSVVVPQTGAIAHRNTVHLALTGFGNAYLLTGDRRYVKLWARMIDTINANARVVDGKRMYPRMYGDEGWYAWSPEPYARGALEVWYWTQEEEDRRRVAGHPWVRFLEGKDPDYAVRVLRRDLLRIRERAEAMRRDTTTPDTRLADDPLRFNPASAEALVELALGGFHPGRKGAPLHARLRHFDPVRRRAGLPPDVAVLVTGMGGDYVSARFVNLNAIEPRTVTVQAGAYAEHRFTAIESPHGRLELDPPRAHVEIRIAPGAGGPVRFSVRRYAAPPTLLFPWDRVLRH